MMISSALLVALDSTARGNADGTGDARTGGQTGRPSPPASVEERSDEPPTTEAKRALRRPKPGIPLSVTPPPIESQSGPTEPTEPA